LKLFYQNTFEKSKRYTSIAESWCVFLHLHCRTWQWSRDSSLLWPA